MKRILAIILTCSLLLCSCSPTKSVPASSDNAIAKPDTSLESDADDTSISDDSKQDDALSNSNSTDQDTALSSASSIDYADNTIDFTIKGLNDDELIDYVEDNIYSTLVSELNSEDFFVENVEAVYYPKEYIKEISSNSRRNVYFGYTADELDAAFNGEKYVFTLGENGQTVVVPMDTMSDDIYVKAMEDAIVGAGVILVCVTVSLVSAPAAPAISMIFAASASTGTSFALNSSVLSFASAAIVKGYETESAEQALKAGVEAAGKGFKWGAISGAVLGGGSNALTLKGLTRNGLTMNDAARIQKESGYPVEVIKQFKSYEEYKIYKEAGLYTRMVNGKLALVRDINLDFVSQSPNGEYLTNLERMRKGLAPIDPVSGKPFQLHHINQDPNGTLAILTEAEHQGNSAILNVFGKPSAIDRPAFDVIRAEFWKKLAASLI